MNDAELLNVIHEIGAIYGDISKLLDEISLYISFEAQGFKEPISNRENISRHIRIIRQSLDRMTLPKWEDKNGAKACGYWIGIDCYLRGIEEDLFGGREEWITGESSHSLQKLTERNTVRISNMAKEKSSLAEWGATIHKAISDAAQDGEKKAQTAQARAEGERDAWKTVANGKLDGIQDGVSANGKAIEEARGEFREYDSRRADEILQFVNGIREKEKTEWRLDVMIAGAKARFMPGWQVKFARERGKKRQAVGRAHNEALEIHPDYRKTFESITGASFKKGKRIRLHDGIGHSAD